MQPIILFYMEHCPYCEAARRALDALYEKEPSYRTIPIEWVEENRARERAARYDYYYVPSAFFGGQKLFEARPGDGYARLYALLEAALLYALRSPSDGL